MLKKKMHMLNDTDIRVHKQNTPDAGVAVDTQLQAGNDCGNAACCEERGGTWQGLPAGCKDHGSGDWD